MKIYTTNELTDEDKDRLFQMYSNTYTNAGEDLWFKTKEQLFERYHCLITTNDTKIINAKAYLMYQIRNTFNKISLICHDGTEEGKKLCMDLVLELINTSGWMIEAANKVSWILRKNNAPMILDKSQIVEALNVSNDDIIINSDFNVGEKNTYHYERIYVDPKTHKKYISKETLFGTTSCDYVTNESVCFRKCKNKLGGKKTRKKNKRNCNKRNYNKRNCNKNRSNKCNNF